MKFKHMLYIMLKSRGGSYELFDNKFLINCPNDQDSLIKWLKRIGFKLEKETWIKDDIQVSFV